MCKTKFIKYLLSPFLVLLIIISSVSCYLEILPEVGAYAISGAASSYARPVGIAKAKSDARLYASAENTTGLGILTEGHYYDVYSTSGAHILTNAYQPNYGGYGGWIHATYLYKYSEVGISSGEVNDGYQYCVIALDRTKGLGDGQEIVAGNTVNGEGKLYASPNIFKYNIAAGTVTSNETGKTLSNGQYYASKFTMRADGGVLRSWYYLPEFDAWAPQEIVNYTSNKAGTYTHTNSATACRVGPGDSYEVNGNNVTIGKSYNYLIAVNNWGGYAEQNVNETWYYINGLGWISNGDSVDTSIKTKYNLNVSSTGAKFDVYINGSRVATNVTAHNANYTYGSTYRVVYKSTNTGYTYTGNAQYTGELVDAKTVTLPCTVNSYNVTLNTSTGIVGTTGAGAHKYGNIVNIAAQVGDNYVFVGWYDGDTCISTEPSYTFTMPANNVTYTAKVKNRSSSPYTTPVAISMARVNTTLYNTADTSAPVGTLNSGEYVNVYAKSGNYYLVNCKQNSNPRGGWVLCTDLTTAESHSLGSYNSEYSNVFIAFDQMEGGANGQTLLEGNLVYSNDGGNVPVYNSPGLYIYDLRTKEYDTNKCGEIAAKGYYYATKITERADDGVIRWWFYIENIGKWVCSDDVHFGSKYIGHYTFTETLYAMWGPGEQYATCVQVSSGDTGHYVMAAENNGKWYCMPAVGWVSESSVTNVSSNASATYTLTAKLTNGTFDVYINDALKANDVSSYSKTLPYGSVYRIQDVKADTGYVYTEETFFSGELTKNTTVFDATCPANNFKVTLTNGTGISSSTGAGTYKYGETVTISAEEGTGHTFNGWWDGDTCVSMANPYTFVMPAKDVTYTTKAKVILMNSNTTTEPVNIQYIIKDAVARQNWSNSYAEVGNIYEGQFYDGYQKDNSYPFWRCNVKQDLYGDYYGGWIHTDYLIRANGTHNDFAPSLGSAGTENCYAYCAVNFKKGMKNGSAGQDILQAPLLCISDADAYEVAGRYIYPAEGGERISSKKTGSVISGQYYFASKITARSTDGEIHRWFYIPFLNGWVKEDYFSLEQTPLGTVTISKDVTVRYGPSAGYFKCDSAKKNEVIQYYMTGEDWESVGSSTMRKWYYLGENYGWVNSNYVTSSATTNNYLGSGDLNASLANGTFDIYVNGVCVGDDVSSYSVTTDYSSVWTITDIKANESYTLPEDMDSLYSGIHSSTNSVFDYDCIPNIYNVELIAGTNIESVSGANSYATDSSVTISAEVEEGYTFSGWWEDGVCISTDNPYTFNMPAKNLSYIAKTVAHISDVTSQNDTPVAIAKTKSGGTYSVYQQPSSTTVLGTIDGDCYVNIYGKSGNYYLVNAYQSNYGGYGAWISADALILATDSTVSLGDYNTNYPNAVVALDKTQGAGNGQTILAGNAVYGVGVVYLYNSPGKYTYDIASGTRESNVFEKYPYGYYCASKITARAEDNEIKWWYYIANLGKWICSDDVMPSVNPAGSYYHSSSDLTFRTGPGKQYSISGNSALQNVTYDYLMSVQNGDGVWYYVSSKGWVSSSQVTNVTTVQTLKTLSANLTNGTFDVYVNDVRQANDVSSYSAQFTYGSVYKIQDVKANDGYIYTGHTYYTGEITYDMTPLNASCIPDNFEITLSKSEHIISVSGAGTYSCGQEVTISAETEKGYHLSGWWEAGECKSTENPYTFNVPPRNFAYEARAEINTYYVQYNGNGATSGSTATSTHTYDIEQDLTANEFTRTGYTFEGWATSATGEVVYTDEQSVSNLTDENEKVVTLYAVWSAKSYSVNLYSNLVYGLDDVTNASQYNISYSVNNKSVTVTGVAGGTGDTDCYGFINARVKLEAGKTYRFMVDHTSSSFGASGKDTEAYLMLNGIYSTYIHMEADDWTFVPEVSGEYWLRLDVNRKGETYTFSNIMITEVIEPITVTYDSTYFNLPTLSRSGYIHVGWVSDDVAYYNSGYTYKNNPWVCYADNHEDLYEAFGYSEAKLENHYRTYGSKDGEVSWRKPYQYKNGSIVDRVSNHSLYAVWMAVDGQYVAFDANGGACDKLNQEVVYESAYGTLPTPTRTGYTFNGWFTEESGGTQITSTTKVVISSNHTIYAQWTANTYTVVYDANTGEGSMSSVTHTYDIEQDLTTNGFTKTGYTFEGWNTKADGTGTSYSDKESVKNLTSTNDGTVTLYARWSAKTDTKYVVEHYLEDLNASTYTLKDTESLTGTSDAQVTPGVKSYEGFTAPSTQTVTISADGSTVVEYYYTRNSYTVSLTAGIGIAEVTGAGTYEYGEKVIITASASKFYRFIGWVSNGVTVAQDNPYVFNMPGNNLSYSTSAVEDMTNIYYLTVTKGTGIESVSGEGYYTVGETVNLSATPALGYSVRVWTSNIIEPVWYSPYCSFVMMAGNATVAVHGEANGYSVVYNGNGATGGSTETSTHSYDTAKALTSNGFIKPGYTFDGWATSADGEVVYKDSESVKNLTTENGGVITLYAKWSLAKYTVNLYSNLLYGLADTAQKTDNTITYSIKNKKITATANLEEGGSMGYPGGYVYLEAGKKYTFSMEHTGTYGPYYEGGDVKVFFLWEGNWQNESDFIHMHSANYTFTPDKTGEYWMRIDVSDYGETHEFSNIVVSEVIDPITVTYGSSYSELPTLQRDGYVHLGWVDESVAKYDSSYNYKNNPWVYYADTYSDIYAAYGYNETKLEEHYRKWVYNEGKIYPVPYQYNRATTVTKTENHSLYALWMDSDGLYVTFDANGGSCNTLSKAITYGSTYGELPTPTRIGYTFSGWYTETNGDTEVTASTIVSTQESHTIYAQWTANTYTIEYNANGGEGSMDSALHTYDAPKNLIANTFTKIAYVFVSWNTKADGSGTTYTDGENIKNLSSENGATITLYAIWRYSVPITIENYVVDEDGNDVSDVYNPDDKFKFVIKSGAFEKLPTSIDIANRKGVVTSISPIIDSNNLTASFEMPSGFTATFEGLDADYTISEELTETQRKYCVNQTAENITYELKFDNTKDKYNLDFVNKFTSYNVIFKYYDFAVGENDEREYENNIKVVGSDYYNHIGNGIYSAENQYTVEQFANVIDNAIIYFNASHNNAFHDYTAFIKNANAVDYRYDKNGKKVSPDTKDPYWVNYYDENGNFINAHTVAEKTIKNPVVWLKSSKRNFKFKAYTYTSGSVLNSYNISNGDKTVTNYVVSSGEPITKELKFNQVVDGVSTPNEIGTSGADDYYVFSHWSTDPNGATVLNTSEIFQYKVTKDMTIYAVYRKESFDEVGASLYANGIDKFSYDNNGTTVSKVRINTMMNGYNMSNSTLINHCEMLTGIYVVADKNVELTSANISTIRNAIIAYFETNYDAIKAKGDGGLYKVNATDLGITDATLGVKGANIMVYLDLSYAFTNKNRTNMYVEFNTSTVANRRLLAFGALGYDDYKNNNERKIIVSDNCLDYQFDENGKATVRSINSCGVE